MILLTKVLLKEKIEQEEIDQPARLYFLSGFTYFLFLKKFAQ